MSCLGQEAVHLSMPFGGLYFLVATKTGWSLMACFRGGVNEVCI